LRLWARPWRAPEARFAVAGGINFGEAARPVVFAVSLVFVSGGAFLVVAALIYVWKPAARSIPSRERNRSKGD